MKTLLMIVGLLVGLSQPACPASESADQPKANRPETEDNKDITVEDLARGLKSAEQNVEKEIPKIGSAIGNAVKKLTEKEPEKPSSQEPSKEKK